VVRTAMIGDAESSSTDDIITRNRRRTRIGTGPGTRRPRRNAAWRRAPAGRHRHAWVTTDLRTCMHGSCKCQHTLAQGCMTWHIAVHGAKRHSQLASAAGEV
jgi:hypothetical protein